MSEIQYDAVIRASHIAAMNSATVTWFASIQAKTPERFLSSSLKNAILYPPSKASKNNGRYEKNFGLCGQNLRQGKSF